MVIKGVSVLYEWTSGYTFRGIDATAAGEELERLREENDGELTSDVVLEDAKFKRSVLHNAFEWDDAAAAHTARKQTANQIILNCRIVQQTNGQRTARAYVYTRVPQEDGSKRGFYTTYNQCQAERAAVFMSVLGV